MKVGNEVCFGRCDDYYLGGLEFYGDERGENAKLGAQKQKGLSKSSFTTQTCQHFIQ